MELDEPTELLALPAAHSMDTQWFAVDELGHVAMFRTGELGSVPEAATRHWPPGSMIESALVPMLAAADAAALSYEAADIFAAKPRWFDGLLGSSLIDAPPRSDESLHSVLLQLRSPGQASERLAELGLHVLPSRDGDYAWGHIESPALRELWREGWIVRAQLGHAVECTRLGMFFFEHEDEASEVDDVYRRWGTPRVPLRVHGLPTSLRRRLAATRFHDLDFRASETLRASRAVGAEENG